MFPEHGGIDLAGRRASSFNAGCVAVALHQRQPGAGGGGGQGIAQLADAAANGGHHAAFTNFAAQHKAFAGADAAQLLPEAEHGACRQLHPIKGGNGLAQVVHLASHQRKFIAAPIAPQRAAQLGNHRCLRQRALRGGHCGPAAHMGREGILRQALGRQQPYAQPEPQGLPARGQGEGGGRFSGSSAMGRQGTHGRRS